MVTFETKVWENDWQLVMQSKRLQIMIERNAYNFRQRNLLINNVADPERVKAAARKLIDRRIITNYYLVDDYADQVLDYFKLSREELGQGYVYSIAELAGIYLCQTPYLLHYSSDAIADRRYDWLGPAIGRFQADERLKVANLCWNGQTAVAKAEAIGEDKDFYFGQGFSDQCYLIKVEDFKRDIYRETNEASQRYPAYGGELFEKRVDAWIRNHSYLRATYKHGSYWHRNIPKNIILKMIRKYFLYSV